MIPAPSQSALHMFREITHAVSSGLRHAQPTWHFAMQIVPPAQVLPVGVYVKSNAPPAMLPFEAAMTPTMRDHYDRQLESLVTVIPQQRGHATLLSAASPVEPHLEPWRFLGLRGRRVLRQATRQAPRTWQTPLPERLLRRPTNTLIEAPVIVYPEDALRERFYSDHPFELARPQTLVDPQPECVAAKMGTVRGFDNATSASDYGRPLEQRTSVSGEDVIQRQLFLIAQGNTVEEAYDLALEEFYNVRKLEEETQLAQFALATAEDVENASLGLKSDYMKKRYPINYEAWIQEEKALLETGDGSVIKSKVLPSDRSSIFD